MLDSQFLKPKFILSSVFCGSPNIDPTCDFQVAWQINPHMKIGASSLPVARQEHERFKLALEEAGAEVELVPFIQGAYDSVFMKDNAAVLTKNKKN